MKNTHQHLLNEVDSTIDTAIALHRQDPKTKAHKFVLSLRQLLGMQRIRPEHEQQAKELLQSRSLDEIRFYCGHVYYTVTLGSCAFTPRQAQLYSANFNYVCPDDMDQGLHQQVEAQINEALKTMKTNLLVVSKTFDMKVETCEQEAKLRSYLADRRIYFWSYKPEGKPVRDFTVFMRLDEALLTYEQRQEYLRLCLERKKQKHGLAA